MSERFDVFVSYAREDRLLVEPLVALLRREEFSVWFDRREMAGGHSTVGQIADALDNSSHTLVCLTDDYLRKRWTRYELDSSLTLDLSGRSGCTIPVILRPLTREFPNVCRPLMRCDFTEGNDYESEFRKITQALRHAGSAMPTASTIGSPVDGQHDGEDPLVAITGLRRRAMPHLRQIARGVLGPSADGAGIDELLDRLIAVDDLPDRVRPALEQLAFVGRDLRVDRSHDVGAAAKAHARLRVQLPALEDAAQRLAESAGGQTAGASAEPAWGGRLAPAAGRRFERVEVCPLDGRAAWPMGRDRALVWEVATGGLAVVAGSYVRWRHESVVPIRFVTCAPGDRLAVSGWDGSVRVFCEGELHSETRLDGAVGAAAFLGDALVVGSWKRSLVCLDADGHRHEVFPVERGVHRIAVGTGSRLSVADLAGGLLTYTEGRLVENLPTLPEPAHDESLARPDRASGIVDLAFAGDRLDILTERGLRHRDPGEAPSVVESRPGAIGFIPSCVAGRSLLLVDAASPATESPALQVWGLGPTGGARHLVSLPAGHRLLSSCGRGARFTLSPPGGGCTYWRPDAGEHRWPDATAATVSVDGGLVAVCRAGVVELHQDRR